MCFMKKKKKNVKGNFEVAWFSFAFLEKQNPEKLYTLIRNKWLIPG